MATFEPGQSGNPGGVPKVSANLRRELREAAQEYAIEALEVIAGVMRNQKASSATRMKAAALMLDRAIGKALVLQDIDLRFSEPDVSDFETARRIVSLLDRVTSEVEEMQ